MLYTKFYKKAPYKKVHYNMFRIKKFFINIKSVYKKVL